MRKHLTCLAIVSISLAACDDSAPEVQHHDSPTIHAAPAPEVKPTEVAPSSSHAPATKPARRFLQIDGEIKLDGAAATVDMEIPMSATITTGPNGHGYFTFGPGSVIEIRKSSTLKIGSSNTHKDSLKLLAGALWSVLAPGASYEVHTHNAVAGVRGTVFYTEARNEKTSYICACDGKVDIEAANPKNFKKTIPSKMQHKAFLVNNKGKGQAVKPFKRVNHTDQEKEALLAFLSQVP